MKKRYINVQSLFLGQIRDLQSNKHPYICIMITIDNIWEALVEIVPLFSSFTLIYLLLLALRDSKTNRERSVKLSFLLYLIVFTAGYLSLTLYTYLPSFYVYFSSFTLAAFMFTPILFYRLAWMLTDTGRKAPFPYAKHFPLPAILTLTLIIWSTFIPFPIQLDLIRGQEINSDYSAFSLFFRSKLFVGSVFVLIYVALSLVRLANYYRAMNQGAKPCKCPTQLMLFIAVPIFMLPLVSAVLLKALRNEGINSLLAITLLLIIFVVLHSIMGYNIICRRFVLYLLPTEESSAVMPKRAMRQIAERVENTEGKIVAVPLTRKRFEEYFREYKPYLSPELKITDLIEPLKANRTVISNFVNKTYGLNFNRYINRLRIKELERLKSLPANKEIEIALLLSKAGFSSMRNYTRSLAAEQDKQPTEDR